jgi:hypothetical protein
VIIRVISLITRILEVHHYAARHVIENTFSLLYENPLAKPIRSEQNKFFKMNSLGYYFYIRYFFVVGKLLINFAITLANAKGCRHILCELVVYRWQILLNRGCVTSLEWAKSFIIGYALVETSGTGYFKI